MRWIKTWRNYYFKKMLMRKMMKKTEHGDDNPIVSCIEQRITVELNAPRFLTMELNTPEISLRFLMVDCE